MVRNKKVIESFESGSSVWHLRERFGPRQQKGQQSKPVRQLLLLMGSEVVNNRNRITEID